MGQLIDVRKAGMVGDPASGANAAANTAILNKLIAQGLSCYFPGGYTWELNAVPINNKDRILLRGDGWDSRIELWQNLSTLFWFQDCNDIEVRNLHLVGRNITSGALESTSSGSTIGCLKATRCEGVLVEDNYVEGTAGYGIGISGSHDVQIQNNRLRKNESFSNADTSDIHVYSIAGTPPDISKFVNIQGNQCHSNARVMISASLRQVSRAVIDGNVVVPLLDNGDEASSNLNCRVKENITIQYNTDITDIDAEGTQRLVVSNNHCKNATWSNIYASGTLANAKLGVIASITGNVLEKPCIDVAGATPLLQAGISLIHFDQVSVTGNVVKDVQPSDNPSARPTSAMSIACRREGSTGPPTGSITITGNVCSNMADRGIYVWEYGVRNLIISDNVLSEMVSHAIITLSGHAERCVSICGNIIDRTIATDAGVISLNADSFDQNMDVIGNVIRDSGTHPSTRTALFINTRKGRVVGNTIIGGGTNHRGVYLSPALTTRGEFLMADNRIENCATGIRYDGSSAVPLVHSNTQFENCPVTVENPTRILAGSYQDGKILARYDAAPTTIAAQMLVGDRIFRSDIGAQTDFSEGAYCITAGTPGTWRLIGGKQPTGEMIKSWATSSPTQGLSSSDAAITILDTTRFQDRVTTNIGTGTLTVQEPGRYRLYVHFTGTLSGTSQSVVFSVTVNGSLVYQFARTIGTSQTETSLNVILDITQAQVTAGGNVQLLARVGSGTPTLTMNRGVFGLSRI